MLRSGYPERVLRTGSGVALQVVMGACLRCSYGAAPSSLVVTSQNRVFSTNLPAANIMDHVPMVNILPFGTCSSPANPTVAAATVAAKGVPTPMPCIPATLAPWVAGASTVLIGNLPALDHRNTLHCVWGGEIRVETPGQMTVAIP